MAGLDELGRFAASLGLRLDHSDGDRVTGGWTASPAHHQPQGIVHGGVLASIVETVASVGGATWLGERGHVVGVSNTTDFLRAVREGDHTVEGTPLHRGRLQQLWQVHITDQADRLVARGQVRLQNISADHLSRPGSST